MVEVDWVESAGDSVVRVTGTSGTGTSCVHAQHSPAVNTIDSESSAMRQPLPSIAGGVGDGSNKLLLN